MGIPECYLDAVGERDKAKAEVKRLRERLGRRANEVAQMTMQRDRLIAEYVWATEVNLATLDELCCLKSTSKSRIERQRSICLKMLQVCHEHASEIPWHGPTGVSIGRKGSCSRVKKMLEPGNLTAVMDEYVNYCKGVS